MVHAPADNGARPRGAKRVDLAPLQGDAPFASAGRLSLTVGMGIFTVAGVAILTGASYLVFLVLCFLGSACLLVGSLVDQAERRRRRALRNTAERAGAEFEALADRMWELQESEQRFLGLIDALGDLVVHRDRAGRIVYANRVFADLVGLAPDSLAGTSLEELGISVDMAPESAFFDASCLTSADVAIRDGDAVRWFSWIEHSVRDPADGSVSRRAIAREITARKDAEAALIEARERAEAGSRAKSRFLATVSHEIRTPMNGILGMAKLLVDTGLSEEQKTYATAVTTSAEALMVLIDDLLDFSKIEAGKLAIERRPVRVRETVENVVELMATRAFAKDIGVGCHVDPRIPNSIETDPDKLRQVLLNLVANAVKFTETGGVLVTVAPASGPAGQVLRFCVRDTGPGLTEQDRCRIFQEFEQADGTSTRRHGGAGLGLAISSRIVEALGGTIAVESEPETGSTFLVDLPCEAIAADLQPRLDGKRYLVIHGNAMEAEAILSRLRAEGAEAVYHDDLASAGTAPPGRYDAILIDAAREHDEALAGLGAKGIETANPVILITPTDRGRLDEFRARGFANFLARPVRGKTLMRILGAAGADAQEANGHSLAGLGGTGRGLTVLVAEDNDVNALLARAALTRAGHTVKVVGDGRAAVEACRSGETFDVVLMDLHMPVMDGLDAIDQIRKHEEQAGRNAVPIVVLTADSQEETRARVTAHGANGLVTKPLDPMALATTVADLAA